MKKFLTSILAAALVLTLCPAAFAQGAATYSDKGAAFIEGFEGYRQTQYEDPVGSGNYYIGYGTKCDKDQYPDGVTQTEADAMMKNYLDTTVVPELNGFVSKNKLSLTQQQYDALASFSYNLGGSWMSDSCRIGHYVITGLSNYTPIQIVDAMGVWAHQGTAIVDGLINRRIREAQVLLYGDYTGQSCPQFSWLAADLNGGTLDNDIFCFQKDGAYGFLPEPTLTGKYFAGWAAKETGKTLKAADTVSRNLHVTATWSDTPVMSYTDVAPGAWYYDAVAYCYAQRLMSGTSDTTFEPDKNTTRAMLVTILWTMYGAPSANYEMTFQDVPGGQWYTEAVRWAASAKLVSGRSASSFGPDDDVTRQDMVAILYKYAVMQGKNTDFDAAKGLGEFADAGDAADYAAYQLAWATQMHIIDGYSENGVKLLKPKATATRAQIAQIIKSYTMT